MTIRTLLSALAVSAGLTAVSFGQITGTVSFEGEPPIPDEVNMAAVRDCAQAHAGPVFDESVWVGEEGGLKNVVVSIQAPEGMPLPGDVPEEPAVLDQEGCMYTPRVVPIMTGQQLLVKNSDAFMHNVHSQSRVNPRFNINQPTVDEGREAPSPRVPETFRIRCDVHPWMTAYMRALDHPYFARTDEDGGFSFDVEQLPDGEYTVVAWHEVYGEQEQQVNIQNGQGEVDFSFQAGQAQASPYIEVRLVDDGFEVIEAGNEDASDDSRECCGGCGDGKS